MSEWSDGYIAAALHDIGKLLLTAVWGGHCRMWRLDND